MLGSLLLLILGVWGPLINESLGYLLRRSIGVASLITLNYTGARLIYLSDWTIGGFRSYVQIAIILAIYWLTALGIREADIIVGTVLVQRQNLNMERCNIMVGPRDVKHVLLMAHILSVNLLMVLRNMAPRPSPFHHLIYLQRSQTYLPPNVQASIFDRPPPRKSPLRHEILTIFSSHDVPSTSHITYVPTPSPPRFNNWPQGPVNSLTPPNLPLASPTNSVGSDLDFLLQRKTLDLCTLTIHKPSRSSSPHISPNSAGNTMVRRKKNHGSRHFWGRPRPIPLNSPIDRFLVDVPIADVPTSPTLGA